MTYSAEVYWCEQKKESKNTCSNARSRIRSQIFQATQDDAYLKKKGKGLYEWTKKEPGRLKRSSIL